MNQSAHKTLQDLINGNRRFLEGHSLVHSEKSLEKLKNFATSGQKPKAIILCCSDARAPVEIIFDQDIGDLFVIRVAGNIVAPSLVGSVEFAASAFNTQLVVVMGHTQCGAIAATIEHIQKSETHSSENIHDIIARIKPHIHSIAKTKGRDQKELLVDAVKANVIASVDHLKHGSKILEELVMQDKVSIVGAVFKLETGDVEFF